MHRCFYIFPRLRSPFHCLQEEIHDGRRVGKAVRMVSALGLVDDLHGAAILLQAFLKNGGITATGGEPLSQPDFLLELFKSAKAKGIHTCLDTSGGTFNSENTEKIDEILSYTDLVMLDIKQFNPERHTILTERQNKQTLATAKWLQEQGRPFWIRYVLVQGYSAFEEDMRALGEHFKGYDMIKRVEILPYHTLGAHKYEPLGMEYKLKGVKENTPEQLDAAKAIFDEYFDCVFVN